MIEFRDKLLDLSGRNRLLNYRHTDQARQIRIIDRSLKSIHEVLCNNELIRLTPLPVPDEGIAKEDTESDIAKKCFIRPTFDLQITSSTLIPSRSEFF